MSVVVEKSLMVHRLVVAVVFLVTILCFAGLPLPVASASTSLTISNAVIVYHRTSLQLASGALLYLYGFATGGSFPSYGFKNGQYASVLNGAGNLVAALAVTSSNTNSFATWTGNQALGGVAVSGYSSYTSSYNANSAWGAPEVSDTFTVRIPGSLVVIVALGGLQGCMNLTGISSMQFDAPTVGYTGVPNGHPGMTIAHAYLDPGTYTITEHARCPGSANMVSQWQGDLIGAFIFTPGKT